MTIYLSLLAAVVGAVIYFVGRNVKLEELGRLAFGAGLLAFLLTIARQAIRLVN